jgi:hypothetical protein
MPGKGTRRSQKLAKNSVVRFLMRGAMSQIVFKRATGPYPLG